MSKTKMFKFNVKSLKYAPYDTSTDEYDSPKDLAYANSISLEADYDETTLYGDGEILAILGDDKGKTGTLDVTNIEEQYEVDMGRMKEVEGGYADVEQRKSQKHAIYYETNAIKDNQTITIKNWLYNCVTGQPSETYEQTEDDPTINTYEYDLTVMGDMLMDEDGTTYYKDENGNNQKVFRITAYPEDDGYDTFEDEVPTPQIPSTT